jgi:hypothetical protein
MRNRVQGKLPVWIATFDSLNYVFLTTRNPFDTLERFIWTLPFDAESLKFDYWWIKGPHFFELDAGTHTLLVFPYLSGSELDRIGLKREAPPSIKKPSYYALKNLAEVWDGRWVRDTLIGFETESGNVPYNDWQELRTFAFRDTFTGSYGVAYWIGVPPYDDFYPDYEMELTLWTNYVNEPVVFDFRDGSITYINYILTDSTVIFPNLPVTDVPRFLALDINSIGVEETSGKTSIKLISISTLTKGELKFTFTQSSYSPLVYVIYDVAGRKTKGGFLGNIPPGIHRFKLKLGDLPSGPYFLLLKTKGNRVVGKFLLLR